MPNTASAKKRLRQNETRRQRNRGQRSDLRTSIRKVNAALVSINDAYVSAQKKLDKAGAKNLIHRNKAARTKSRLQARIQKAKA